MTAEIAVMNKSAIALAADSTVTIDRSVQNQSSRKTYNTVNKLFTLSKFQPVGVMIYGDAHMMGVPWETIVKLFRKELHDRKFDRLDEYVDELIRFVSRNHTLFPPDHQRRVFGLTVGSLFHSIKQEIDGAVKKATEAGNTIPADEVQRLGADVIGKKLKLFSDAPRLPHLEAEFEQRLHEEYGEEITQARQSALQNHLFDAATEQQLRELASLLYSQNVFPDIFSGVVVAGFGDLEPFPSIVAFDCHGVALDVLKHRIRNRMQITFDQDGVLMPFAQSDVVQTFIEGVDPDYRKLTEGYLKRMLERLPEIIVDSLDDGADKDRAAQIDALKEAIEKEVNQFASLSARFVQKKHVDPLRGVIAVLPKDELAAMAATLVNLTSFKRKMSLEIETVGGPIDVAVISKGDGFVWVSRKHYFDPALNHHFLQNYLRG